jgi:hypothetical protein
MRKGNGGKTIPLIDNALLNIAVHQPENVRLQIFKTVMEAMYVGKQTLTSDDQKALETLSIELAINLPVSLLNKMTPGDLRREIVATYDAVKSNIAERHSHLYNAMRGKAVLPDQEKALKNIKMWGPAGTLFLEDLSGITEEENAQRSESKNGFTAATVKANGVLAKKQAEEVCAETGACGNSAASSVPLAASGSRK